MAADGEQQSRGPEEDAAVVVVAARAAAREVPRTAVAWALTHVVQRGDSILLLVLMPPPPSSGTHLLTFPTPSLSAYELHCSALQDFAFSAQFCLGNAFKCPRQTDRLVSLY